ncbi:MAG: nucleotidyltransferase [bacterium]
MSYDEIILLKILCELKKVNLEAIIVGNVAGVLQGVPVMTQDIDFFVRDTELNKKKINQFASNLDLFLFKPDEAISETIRAEGKEFIVDFVFRLAPDQSFEGIRKRAKRIKIGSIFCKVASLEDVLKAKTYVNRDKDKAVLKIIQDTIRIKNRLEKSRKLGHRP